MNWTVGQRLAYTGPFDEVKSFHCFLFHSNCKEEQVEKAGNFSDKEKNPCNGPGV